MLKEVQMRKVNPNTVNWLMRHIHDTHQGTKFPTYFTSDRKELEQIIVKYKEMEKEYMICIVERGNQPHNAKLINSGFFHVLYEDENQPVLYMVT